ncbi:DUF6457 domain-containing protein [Dactylosporangium sp. NPDC051485]|uniref:DUF6457 domain-containing protein n=1 Tax=Dactylosporangium sp. NPDC051485 TaxID=3154846 RepID=UPI003424EBF9
MVLLAADLPLITGEAVSALARAVGDKDGAVFVDEDGQRQLLCGAWRVEALARAVRGIGEPTGGSVRRLVAGLDVREVRWERDRPPYFDCDTEEDLRAVNEDVLGQWLGEAAAALGVEAPSREERAAVLDLARDVAHNVARPGAPLTAFLLGVAVGRGVEAQEAAQLLSRLATRAE